MSQNPGMIKRTVLRLSRADAIEVIEQFERGDGQNVDTDKVQLLERFFLEHEGDIDLSQRYTLALERSTGPR